MPAEAESGTNSPRRHWMAEPPSNEPANTQRENSVMSKIRTIVVSIAIAGAVVAGMAFAPGVSSAQSTSQSMTDKAKSATEDVSKWTQKQWNAAKAKWVKQKDKWNSCNKQATDKKLSGRESWSFLYTCMTS